MPIYELFSKRKGQAEKGGQADIYVYDELVKPFRVQVIHILGDTIGAYKLWASSRQLSNVVWDAILKILKKEYGVFKLNDGATPRDQILSYLLQSDTLHALDIIELSMRAIETWVSKWTQYEMRESDASQSVEDAVDELNARFVEHGIGYEYLNRTLIRKDSQFIHNEIVKPAISLLYDVEFLGAQEEFLNAYKFYRQGDRKQSVAEALKALESTMKTICEKMGWNYPPNATAIPLIKVLLDNGLIPSELESHFSGLRVSLESGLPTISNKTSRHGQGIKPNIIEDYMVQYALNLCAANIVLLVNLYKSHK